MRLPSYLLLLLFSLPICSRLAAQNVRLTEFMAINATGITDEDGTVQGWIEIWNPHPINKVDITGTMLKSGTSSWTVPNIELMPDERMIVWASGKNRTVVTAPLHTNFTLPASGQLTITRSDGSTLSRINYPAQTADVSFGRDEWDVASTATQVGSYTNPTPGERNSFSGLGVAGNVVISQPSRAFTGTLQVTLAMVEPDPAATIRYTLDGTPPVATSTVFNTVTPVPLPVTATQMIRARAYKTGLLPGEIETSCFLLLDGTTSNFSSAMPLVAISNFTGGAPPDTGDQAGYLWGWAPAAPDNRARFTNPPVLAGRIVMDKRGSSTLGNPKYNLNVEFRKARDDDDMEVSVFGMPLGSDWVWGAPYNFDRGLIRNPFNYALSNSIGRYAPRTREAEVFIDIGGGALNFSGGASGDYFGVYNLTEKIRRDDDRVDIERLSQYENDAVNKTGGYMFKIDRRDAGDVGFSAGGYTASASGWGTSYYYPNETEIKAPQRDPQEVYLTSAINTFYSALNSASYNNPVTGYAAHLDVPAAIDHDLLGMWPNNLDALRLSAYWFKRRGGKLTPGPVWDYDRSIDCSSDSRDDNPAAWRGGGDGTDFYHDGWWNRLFQDIDFYQKLIDRWQELRRGAFSAAAVNALVDQINAEISAEAVSRDLARWNQTKRAWTRQYAPFTALPASQDAEMWRIKDYLQKRAEFMDSQWVGPVTTSVAEGQVTPGTQITLTGPASSVIYYTLNGADPRPSGGSAAPVAGALTYSGPITINATTRLRARAYKATHTALTGTNNPSLVSRWSGLTNNLYTTDTPAGPGNLVITEINYHPSDPTPAELAANAFLGDNDFEFIELRNLSEGTINLAGCKFTLGVTYAFTGENAVSLPANGYLILCANTAGFTVRYGASGTVLGPFTGSLSNGGETLRLETSNGTLIQEITYSDLWAPDSDGAGKSLVVYNARATSGYGDPSNWRASAALNGSPRAGEPNLPPQVVSDASAAGSVSGVALTAVVTDDGLPENPGTISLGWTQVSGPGTAQFSPSNAAGTSVSFSLPGVYSVRLVAGDGSLSSQANVTVAAQDTLAMWQARHPGIGAVDADFDGDGLSNGAEFALLTDPEQADSGAALTSAREAGGIAVIYRRQTGPGAPAIAVQTSDTLQNFQTPGAAQYTQTIMADDGVTQTVKVVIPAPAGVTRTFVRLLITVP